MQAKKPLVDKSVSQGFMQYIYVCPLNNSSDYIALHLFR